jgi:hypothetical protein
VYRQAPIRTKRTKRTKKKKRKRKKRRWRGGGPWGNGAKRRHM